MSLAGYSIFCDDIRFEVDNKVSYIGVYNQSMLLRHDFPATIAKICIASHLVLPATKPIKRALFRVMHSNEQISEFDHPLPSEEEQQFYIDNFKEQEDAGKVIQMQALFFLSPLIIRGEGLLKVRCDTDSGVERLGALLITSQHNL